MDAKVGNCQVKKIKVLKTKEVLLRLLEDFENLSKELIEKIASLTAQRGPRDDMAKSAMQTVDKIIKKEKEIQQVVRLGEEQITKQQQIALIREEINKRDQEILCFQNQLREAEQILSNALFEAKKKLHASREANRAKITSEDLIKYAFRISSSNSVQAPADWQPGDPRRPYPLDLEMRRGSLGKFPQHFDTDVKTDADTTENNPSDSRGEPQTHAKQLQESSSALNSEKHTFASIWASNEPAHSDIYQQAAEQKEDPYAMISADAVQHGLLNGGQRSSNVDHVEFMSSSSDSSSSDSP